MATKAQERAEKVAAFAAKHKIKGDALDELTALAARPAKSKETRPCGCGCGSTTQRRFAMGHDSKLKSKLQEAWRAKRDIGEAVPAVPGELDPLKIAKVLGWEAYMVERKPKTKKPRKIKEGEQTSTRVATGPKMGDKVRLASPKDRAEKAQQVEEERRLRKANATAAATVKARTGKEPAHPGPRRIAQPAV